MLGRYTPPLRVGCLRLLNARRRVEGYDLANVVETAVARALALAAEAKRWDVVMQIADKLRRRGAAHTRLTPSL